MSFREHLPVDDFRTEIEAAIAGHPVIIVTAETGAGKSTRLPFWLWQKGLRVHVTQPRRLAARALSQYLARSAGVEWGDEIGYQTGFDSRRSARTRLLYLTDGVQMAQEIRHQRNYDVLMLDEIHEWNLNQEILMGLVQNQLSSGYYQQTGKRVVVMSATLKARQLSAFLGHAPLITVPGRLFSVTRQHRSPYFLIPDAAPYVEEGHNVLVFQPGKQEIEDFIRKLRDMLHEDKQKAVILPLHAEISLRDQARVFEKYELPKVVVATDVAQTSLTIDDIDLVIDSGVKKEVRLINGIEGLYPTEISRAECLQRAGRAGRVKEGLYILCSERGMEDREEYPEPEIRRLNLESVVLRLLMWGVSPLDFTFFHKPKRNLILKAIASLQTFGALTTDLQVTPDGRQMADLPVSLRSARLLLEARQGGERVLDRAIRLIAIFETKGIASREFAGERLTPACTSDLLNQLVLWETWKKNRPLVSMKKLALAREIYGELKKRLNLGPVTGSLSAQENRRLYSALLSSFADSVYTRCESLYVREGEERQLDRTSLLLESKPAMIAGLPFDLVIHREDPQTGTQEEIVLPLLTFCSELSLALLEELQPFSYQRRREITVPDGHLRVVDQVHFGGCLLTSVEIQPEWKNPAAMAPVVEKALEWFVGHDRELPIFQAIEKIRSSFSEATSILKYRSEPFEFYLLNFLRRELQRHLNICDLRFFFSFHPGFFRLTLRQLLPFGLLSRLKRAGWPAFISTSEGNFSVTYRRRKAHVVVEAERFMRFQKEDLLLPTGETAGLLLDGRPFESWEKAVEAFNAELRSRVYSENWERKKKPVAWTDLQEMVFPLAFVGGSGKDNTPFEYYLVPEVENNGVQLIHFLERQKAEAHFQKHREAYERLKYQDQQETLSSIFRNKGWKVK